VASRAIRPLGLVEVRPGDEAAFLAHQDIALLSLGQSLLKTIRVTGFREAGELAALTNSEAAALFGRKGIFLRDAAKGIDNSPVVNGGKRNIESRADFSEDVIDENLIIGALSFLAEHCGLQMRSEKLGCNAVRLVVIYNDGMEAHGFEKTKHPLITDSEISFVVCSLYKKTVNRRIRISSVCLSLGDFSPLGFQPDLFEPETETKNHKLQEAVDKIKNRYGAGKIMRASCSEVSCTALSKVSGL
jgi:DNA polymerase-4